MNEVIQKWELVGLIPENYNTYKKYRLALKLERVKSHILKRKNLAEDKLLSILAFPMITRLYEKNILFNEIMAAERLHEFFEDNVELIDAFKNDPTVDHEVELLLMFIKERYGDYEQEESSFN